MKYEKLIRIDATKTVWPENKTENFEAYETKAADEAFKELITSSLSFGNSLLSIIEKTLLADKLNDFI